MRPTDEVFTPASLFELLQIEFDLDPCSPVEGGDSVPARRKLTKVDDGLQQPWRGRVFVNPPYSAAAPWMQRFLTHGDGVALVPFGKTRWLHTLWNAADGIVFLDPTFRFVKAGRPHRIWMPVLLAACGPTCLRAIARCGRLR